MENQPKKSKAIIITIIALVLLLILGYFLFKNKDSFGVKTSTNIAKIFSPLTTSSNPQATLVQAGEDIKKGDSVSVSGAGSNNTPIVVKATNTSGALGKANQDISNGNIGAITPNTKSNSFFNSFAQFLGGMFNKSNQGGISNTPPPGGWKLDSNTGKWSFDSNGSGGWVFDSTLDKWTPPGGIATPPPGGWKLDSNTGKWSFDANGSGGWVFDSTLDKWTPPDKNLCPNGADNPTLCTTIKGQCINGANNPPACTTIPGTGTDPFANFPEVTVIAAPSSIKSGESSTISWTSTNSTSCTAGAGNGTGTTGSFKTGALTKSMSYTVTCTGANGSGANYVFVNVDNTGDGNYAFPTVTATTTPASIKSGESSTISWTSTNSTSCNAGTGNGTGTTGLFKTGTLTKSTSYVITCRGANGSSSDNAFVMISSDLCINGADNPTDCTTIGGKCVNLATNPPACTVIDGICSNGASNPTECTINPDGTCMNGANNPTKCDIFDAGSADLTAGVVYPTGTTVNTPTTLSSTITNVGLSGTEHSFSSFFNISKTTDPAISSIELSTIIPTLEANVGSLATISYTFTSSGEYQIRVCADKSSSSDNGTVTESDENNNCGPWITFTVSDSLPTDGTICSNGADNPDLCTTINGACANGASNPDTCTLFECANKATDYPDCTNIPDATPVNACLEIDKNPLTFTDAEKSQLAELLRKFYLIAPTLKTTDDISLVYSEILKQQNFSSQLSDLINQCYTQTSDPSYTGSLLRYGNPWYQYDNRGSYLDSTHNSTPSYCTKAPGGWPHKSFNCSNFKDKLNCEQYNFTPWLGKKQTLNTGCTWVDNLNLKDYETILNVW